MNSKYNRVEPKVEEVKKRRDRLKANAEKNSDLHEKLAIKPKFGPRSIRDGIRLAAIRNWSDARRGLVSILNGNTYNPITTPAHDIQTLIHLLPDEVPATECPENGNPVMLSFSLPANWWELSKKAHNGGEIAKPYFYQLALSELEALSRNEYRLTPFTFTTSIALERRLQGQAKKRVDFLRDRIQKTLNEALQRPENNRVAFWLALEFAHRGQPHIHGSLLIRPDEQEVVRRAFYELNGGNKMTADEKQGCFRFGLNRREALFIKRGQLYTDLNWASYSLKERASTRRGYDLEQMVAVSQPLVSHAKDYYTRLNREFNRQRRTEKRATNPKNQLGDRFGLW